MSKRPNIIIFNPDEMRLDALAHMGNPASITPHLDAIVKDAVSFRNAFCQNPVCVPSRCSFTTGLYPHVHGHRTMTHLLRPHETSMFKELKDAGYYVWMNDRNDLCAGQVEGWVESHADEIAYQGDRKPAPGPLKDMRGEAGNKFYYSHYEGQLGLDENGKNYTGDDEAIDAAINKINSWKDNDQPLCMFLGLNYPHVPYQVEDPYFSLIDRKKLKKRIRMSECLNKSKMVLKIKENLMMDDMDEEDWDEIRAVYLGMCMKIDELFGKLVEALRGNDMYDNSAIFVLSDHGDFTGDYDLVEKAQSSFEDCLTNVPLLIKPPKDFETDHGISDSLVELTDFYATVMAFADVEPTHTHFGRNLMPVLEKRSVEVRDYVCCEGGRNANELHCDEYHGANGKTASPKGMYYPKILAQSDHDAHAKATMIRNHDYKYVSRITGEDELYDLKKDPSEMHNVIDDPAYEKVISDMRYALLKWLQSTADVVPLDYDMRFTPKMMWSKVKPFVPEEYEEDVMNKIRDGMGIASVMQYVKGLGKK